MREDVTLKVIKNLFAKCLELKVHKWSRPMESPNLVCLNSRATTTHHSKDTRRVRLHFYLLITRYILECFHFHFSISIFNLYERQWD